MDSDQHIRQEEVIVRELYEKLQGASFVTDSNVDVGISGSGVQWSCSTSRLDAHSRIHCFDRGILGPQYLIRFTKGDEKATLRTNSIDEVIFSVSNWMRHSDIKILYEEFPTVDKSKRAATKLYHQLLAVDPTLAEKSDHKLSSINDEFFEVNFGYNIRSCTINYADMYGRNHIVFLEDEVELCSFKEKEVEVVAKAMNFWLLEEHPPTLLGRNFENLTYREVAIYYEIGRPIVGEFLRSWDFVENRYRMDSSFSESLQFINLIERMRFAGYDRIFRAGTSVRKLLLSRARRHWLKSGQPRVGFLIVENMIQILGEFPDEAKMEIQIPYTTSSRLAPELVSILDKLASYPIA